MSPRFLDTNILLRYFTRDDEEKAKRVLALLQRVERAEERVETSLIVIFETVYALERVYHVPREQIRQLIIDVIRMRGIHLPGKDLCRAALIVYEENKELSFADAYHAVYMQEKGIPEIYSWDTDFDDLDWVHRVEPRIDSSEKVEA